MNDAPAYTQFFGDKERDFRLTAELVSELERLTGQGIGGLSRRLMAGDFHLATLHHVIRLGLIGGGTPAQEAQALLAAYTPSLPVLHQYALAMGIIEILMMGPQPAEIPAVTVEASK